MKGYKEIEMEILLLDDRDLMTGSVESGEEKVEDIFGN